MNEVNLLSHSFYVTGKFWILSFWARKKGCDHCLVIEIEHSLKI